MQIIDILGYEQELVCVLRQFRDRLMRSIWLRLANALPSLAIPLPNQFRITRESLRRRQLCRIEVSPVTILATKSRDPAFGGNPRACNYENAHTYVVGESRAVPKAFESRRSAPTLPSYSQPIWRPLFWSSSQVISGLK